jgi:hypothetical protein
MLTYAVEYEPVDSNHGDKPVYKDAASKDAAVRVARRISGKDAPFGPTVYVLALRGDERVGHMVYNNGRKTDSDGEGV